MDTVDWRSQMSLDSRKRIIAHLIQKLEKTIPFSGQSGLIELKQIAADYLRRISEKLHAILEGKFKKAAQDKGNKSEPSPTDSQSMQQQNQIHSQGQIIPILKESNQSQACQQLLPQNVQNNMASSGFQSGMPRPVNNFGGQNMQINISGFSQNSMGQGMPSHIYSIQPRQMQGVQQNNAGQGNALCSMQSGATRPLHQNPASASQQGNISSLSSQSHNIASVRKQSMNTLQSIVESSSQQANTSSLSSQSGASVRQQNMNPLEPNPHELKQQHLKQKQELEMLQSQSQQRQMQSQQYHQQVKQEFPTQEFHQYHQQVKQEFQTHNMPQTQQHQQQMNNVNDMKIRPGMAVIKPGVFPQHLPAAQRQFRPGSQFQVASPKYYSPKIDQQSRLTSISKPRTPLQSANSPFAVPSPSTPLAPSHMPVESEKPVPGTSTLSDAANIGRQQGTGVHAVSGPVKISTPGILASPLLADDTHDTASTRVVSSKSNITEQPPLERLIKAVETMPPVALGAAVSEIASVVIMNDSIAESAPGNRSRAAIGEDLGSMTKCHLRARKFITKDGMNGTRMRRYINAMPLE
ncbi:putative transcription cofactor [Corchorus olitorius]|uniref:Transcription cofactor n=1 Tax=Corchorus olitorius TaxID=93759 RepID=A0A1R3K3A0_9ROSI|nr:putative transcription cofactor [Corchorus olitorius]